MVRVLPKSEQLPHALYRADQVRELDRMAIEQFEIPGEVLMERAGQAAFDLLRERWPDAGDVTVLVGVGNNGGDGFVLARLARQAGLTVWVLQLGDREKLSGDARLNAERWDDLCGEPGAEWLEFDGLPKRTDVIVDGIFGTGLAREVRGSWASAIEAVNRERRPVLALDIPSGLHADTGAVLGVAVRASATMSFIGLKQGLFTGDGPARCGEIRFESLEVPGAGLCRADPRRARRIDWVKQAQILCAALAQRPQGPFRPCPGGGRRAGLWRRGAAGGGGGGAQRAPGWSAWRPGPSMSRRCSRRRPEIMVRGVDRGRGPATS